jgi:hypothetical protein
VPDLSGGDVTLTLAVKGLERLHEVGEGSSVLLIADSLVDGQNLLKFVLLLSCDECISIIQSLMNIGLSAKLGNNSNLSLTST